VKGKEMYTAKKILWRTIIELLPRGEERGEENSGNSKRKAVAVDVVKNALQ